MKRFKIAKLRKLWCHKWQKPVSLYTLYLHYIKKSASHKLRRISLPFSLRSKRRLVEVAGIEPASKDIPETESTCLGIPNLMHEQEMLKLSHAPAPKS